MINTPNNNPASDLKEEPYSIKYSDYFVYNSNSSSYRYNLNIENFADNNLWPLKECLNCKANLEETPPKLTKLIIGKDTISSSVGCVFFIISLISAIMFYILSINVLIWVSLGILVLSSSFFFIMKTYNSTPFEFYNCVKCNVLLFSKSPGEIQVADPPKDVFKKLEQIPGFKLK